MRRWQLLCLGLCEAVGAPPDPSLSLSEGQLLLLVKQFPISQYGWIKPSRN